LSLLRQLAAADQFLARSLAQPLARRIEALSGVDCFRLARLCCLVSVGGDAAVNLSLLRWGGLDAQAGFRTEIGASFALGLLAAGAVILRSLSLAQERHALSAASPMSLAFKFGRWLILLYAGFASACFFGGVVLSLAGLIDPALAAPQPPFAALRFLADRLGDASFLLALYCLELRPRGTADKELALTSAP
jgi:hypothetical protein